MGGITTYQSNGNQIKKETMEKRASKKNYILRNKEFVQRNSLLDDLMESQHIVTVYRLFLALLIGSVIHLAAKEYSVSGEINFGQKLIIVSFASFHKFIIIWSLLFISNFLVYYGFKYWATVRANYLHKGRKVKIWDYVCLTAFIVYLNGWLWFSTWITLTQKMTILCTIITTCEITRMLMKMYAFVRSNTPRVLKYKPHSDNEMLYPTLEHFVYFLWIPTLIYRDNYPRSESIQWKYVATKILEFIAGVFFMSVTIEHYIITSFKDFGIRPYSWSDVGVKITENAIFGVLFTITAFYMVLHVWMGAFAEICRFGDRLFYQDWWTAPNFEIFYRTWNIVIHDWLYTYVYKDFYEIVTPGNKASAKMMTFFLSAVFHEYILYTSFGFVLPIVFIQFFFVSTLFTFVKFKPDAFGNVLILYGIGLGMGCNYTAFALEYFARQNCPIENKTMFSYLVPKVFLCIGV